MKRAAMVSAAMVLSALLPSAVHAQMMHGGMMGGGRRGMINLVSPADSPTQIRRGLVMIGSYAVGMMGPGSAMPTPPATEDRGIRIILRLSGVTDAGGLVTSTDNHLIFEGQLTTPTDNATPITIDQRFALSAGAAVVQVPISMSVSGSATVTIDRIAVEDGGKNPFAVPGVNLTQPTPEATRVPTPGARCRSDDECDDGDPNTQDICMPIGCRHMPRHMGSGGGPMM